MKFYDEQSLKELKKVDQARKLTACGHCDRRCFFCPEVKLYLAMRKVDRLKKSGGYLLTLYFDIYII